MIMYDSPKSILSYQQQKNHKKHFDGYLNDYWSTSCKVSPLVSTSLKFSNYNLYVYDRMQSNVWVFGFFFLFFSFWLRIGGISTLEIFLETDVIEAALLQSMNFCMGRIQHKKTAFTGDGIDSTWSTPRSRSRAPSRRSESPAEIGYFSQAPSRAQLPFDQKSWYPR